MNDRFHWNEHYSVGVHQFDSDHRRLLQLAHTMVSGALRDPLPVNAGEVLGDLIECAEEHFAHEEHLLRVTGYPHLDAHRHEHRRLLEEIRRFRERMSAGQVGADDVARFVADWVLLHIEEEDKQYRSHLNALGYR
jgi:hemerythrin-like metal-binding protein